MVAIEIKPHHTYPTTHSTVIVTVKGRCWACTWAGTPAVDEVKAAWKADRKAFAPYRGY